MATAYTPGLEVKRYTIIEKERKLPILGEVLVKPGDEVEAETIVAKTDLPGNVHPLNVANILKVVPSDVPDYMLKKEGDTIKKDEIIAISKSLFGLLKTTCKSPIDGTIESISTVTGQVILREPPIPVVVRAYVKGKVISVIPKEGVVVQTKGTFIQGIFGVGGETTGLIKVLVNSPNEILSPDLIDETCEGKVLVGGSFVTNEALQKAIKVKAKGVVVGGFDDKDLRAFLGYDLGVAITGKENLGLTLILTEGFGRIKMADATFKLLKEREGLKASINGATQIRAGVIRPEIIVPLDMDEEIIKDDSPDLSQGMTIGTPVRIIREPHFGELGVVYELPHQLEVLESEVRVRVVRVKLQSGEIITLPRANVEIISL